MLASVAVARGLRDDEISHDIRDGALQSGDQMPEAREREQFIPASDLASVAEARSPGLRVVIPAGPLQGGDERPDARAPGNSYTRYGLASQYRNPRIFHILRPIIGVSFQSRSPESEVVNS